MPRNSQGVYTPPAIYEAVSGTTIRSDQHNKPIEDMSEALTFSLPRNGRIPMMDQLPMGGFKITGLAAGTDPGDAARVDQVLPYSAWLSNVSALNMAADQVPYSTGSGGAAATNLTEFGRTIIASADAPAARTALALTDAATAAPLDQATWNGGVSTAETVISPEKLAVRIRAFFGLPATAPAYVARAWGVINGANGSLLNGGGTSSTSRTGVGNYTVTFSTPMPDINYSVTVNHEPVDGFSWAYYARAVDKTVNGFVIRTGYVSGTAAGNYNAFIDARRVDFQVVR